MANKDKENKIKKFTKEAIGKTLNQFNKEIGIADLVEINKNQDRILNGILSQVNDENTEKTEKSNVIMLDNSTDGIVELQEIQGDTNVNVSKITEETPITHVIEDKEGNAISLDDITEGAINIDNIQGNTMVNCNKEADKELVLMEDLSTEGYSNITLNKGVDGGLVDVTLEGNTMVNVCDQKDPVAITKSYTVETGNHVVLQGEYDGKCRPVLNGNTLVNLYNNTRYATAGVGNFVVENNGVTVNNTSETGEFYVIQSGDLSNIKSNTVHTLIIDIETSNDYQIFSHIDDAFTCIGSGNTNTKFVKSLTSGQYLTRFRFDSDTLGGTVKFKNIILLEGDYSDKPIPDYFEGLKSSFEDNLVTQEMVDNGEEVADNLGKYKVDYKVTGKNKFDDRNITSIDGNFTYENGILTTSRHATWGTAGCLFKVPVYLVANTNYYISVNLISGGYRTCLYDLNDKKIMDDFGINICSVNKSGQYYLVVGSSGNEVELQCSNIQLEEGTVATPYEPYKEYKKTFYLNSPLLEGDTIEQQRDNVVHVHRSEIRAYQTDDELTLPTDMTNTLVAKVTPQYEVISTNDTILCDSYVNGHLDVDSVVPIEKVDFLHFEEELTYLYANTQYAVQFVSNAVSKVDITLGGAKLLNQDVVVGTNKYMITTPSTLVDNKLVVSGAGLNIEKVVVTEATDQDFGYFEGMKSVGECEDLEVVSSNKNLFGTLNSIEDLNSNRCLEKNDTGGVMNASISNNSIIIDTSSWSSSSSAIINYRVANLKPNTKYTLSCKVTGLLDGRIYAFFIGSLYKQNIDSEGKWKGEFTTDDYGKPKNIGDKGAFRFIGAYATFEDTVTISNIQIEESSTDTDYIPHQSNTQQLTHEPLRAVGDAKDRYVLVDGKWFIERKCREIVFDGIDEVWHYEAKEFSYRITGYKPNGSIVSNRIPYGETKFSIAPDNHYCIKLGTSYGIIIRNDDISSTDNFKQWLQQNPVTVVYELATPQYEPIDYNPFEVYSDITHISNNSTIPCNMTIKNTGYNCLLKPSTTYTVSSNLGLNTVTTPSVLTEDCLRFYDTDTSDVTTMKNVMVLEGDYTTNGKPIPSHFSGIESCFEQEYDEEKGKYKVKIRVQNEDASKENYIEFYINEPLRGTGTAKDKVFIQDNKVVVERNCGSVTLDGSENFLWDIYSFDTTNNMAGFYKSLSHFNNMRKNGGCISNTLPKYVSDSRLYPHFYIGGSAIVFWVYKQPLIELSSNGFKQWLQQSPTTVVYQLAEPTYEEVEYSSNRLILNTFNNESFNNSTLFLDTNISPKLSFKPLWEELVYVKNSTKYYIQFNAVGSGEVVINLGGTELTTEIAEGYNCIPITTPSESTNLMTIIGQGITISEVVVSEVVCGGYYKGLQSCFEEHMENGKYRILLRGIALDGSKVNGIKLYINEPLRGVGDIKDRLCIKNGKLMVERKCASATFDGSEDENIAYSNTYDRIVFMGIDVNNTNTKIISNNGLCIIFTWNSVYRIGIKNISQKGISSLDMAKQWLQQNPTTVVYQLAEPTYEEATNEYGLPIVLEGYENGIVYIDSAVTPTTHIKYTSNNQLAIILSEAEEQNIATQEDINMNVITYMMDIDMMLTDMEMSNDISVMAVRRDSSNENMLDRMSDEDKKVYRDNTVVMLEKMITANVLDKEDIEGRVDMYYDKNRISKEQYKYLKSLL